MTLRVSFVGPVAPGLAAGREPTANDLLDLQDERIYRTCWPDDPYELQFAGMAALIACCGAWPAEIVRIEKSDLRLKNLSGGASADDPADNSIWLGWGDFRRRIWVPEIARMTLARVTGRITPAEGCTRLFMRRDGTAMSRQVIVDKFGSLCVRTGISGVRLPTRLLAYFEECVSNCDDKLAAAFLTRKLAAMRRARGPGGEGEPTLAQLRKAVEVSHPLGRLTRAMLQHVKPIERAFPDRVFRELSPRATADVAAMRSEPFKNCYPQELVDAVLAAANAGRHQQEIAAHYGIRLTTVREWVYKPPSPSRRRAGLGVRSHQESFLTHARRHPEKTASEVKSWMEERLGVQTKEQYLHIIARREGVKLAHPTGELRNGRDPKRLEAYIRRHPNATVVDVKAWARQSLGRDLSTAVLFRFAYSRGLSFASCFKISGPHAGRLEAYVRANPDADIHDVVAWIERELQTTVAITTVYQFLKSRGLKVRKLPPGKEAAYGPALLEWIAAHPNATVPEAFAWLETRLGTKVSPSTLRSFLRTHSIKLRPTEFASGSKIAGPRAGELEAYVRANPDADIHDVVVWIEQELQVTVALPTVYGFLKDRGLKIRKLPTGKAAPYGPALLAWITAHPNAMFGDAHSWLEAELGTKVNRGTLRGFLRTRGIKLRAR